MEIEEVRDDRPWSESRGAADVDGKWLLTHAIWHPTLPFGGHGNQPETGIRYMDEIVNGRPRFELVQHGWRDFRAAGIVIKRCLRKGRNVDQIAKLMERIPIRSRSQTQEG